MASQNVQAVLERCDPTRLDLLRGNEELTGSGPDVDLKARRWIQKVQCRQLCVLDDMMNLLERMESAQQLLEDPLPARPGNQAHSSWKALKAQTRETDEQLEILISSLLSKLELLHSKRLQLTQLVATLESKRHQCQQLEESLQKAHNALRSCEGQLTQVRAESEVVLSRLEDWRLLKEELQAHLSTTQEGMQLKVLSVSQSEMCIELRPRPCGNSPSGRLQPLQLSVTFRRNNRFSLQQVNQGTAGLVEECVEGPMSELSVALLELVQHYTSQGEMLGEIQALHSRFAIDWRASQRVLVYLKSASAVCSLGVEEGYPTTGQATLLSVRTDTQPVPQILPPKENPSLTEWLEFLSTNPDV